MRTDLPSDVADDELNPQSDEYQRAALLVALLLRYPEIGSVRVSAPTADLTLSFLLSDEPEAARLETLKARIRQALGLLSRLEASALKRRCDFALRRQGPIVGWAGDGVEHPERDREIRVGHAGQEVGQGRVGLVVDQHVGLGPVLAKGDHPERHRA